MAHQNDTAAHVNKRILLISENFPPISGGSGRWFYELYTRLSADKIVILTHLNDDASFKDSALAVTVERIALSCPEWGLKSVKGLSFYFRMLRALRQIVKRHNIDEIHCGRVIHEGVTAWLFSLFTGLPYIAFVHGEDVETAATSREHNLLVKQVCKRAQFLVCNSHNSANIVKRLGYADTSKLHVLHPGVDAQSFVPAEPNPSFRNKMAWENKFVLLTVGRLQKRKGQDILIQAMPQILQQHPNVLYAVVGRGECRPQLAQLVKDLKLEANVQLLSEISDEDMIACYQQCDLFILPNRTIDNDIEGFGMVLVEAQACGKAVIAGDSGGTKETMIPGETGQILDCSDKDSLAAALCSTIAQQEPLRVMGAKGREHVKKEFDWLVHAQKASQILR